MQISWMGLKYYVLFVVAMGVLNPLFLALGWVTYLIKGAEGEEYKSTPEVLLGEGDQGIFGSTLTPKNPHLPPIVNPAKPPTPTNTATATEKEKDRAFELAKMRMEIESLERDRDRAFELRKMELGNQRVEMGRRLANEGRAVEVAGWRVLGELRRGCCVGGGGGGDDF